MCEYFVLQKCGLLRQLLRLFPAFFYADVDDKANTNVEAERYLRLHVCSIAYAFLYLAACFNLNGDRNNATQNFSTDAHL